MDQTLHLGIAGSSPVSVFLWSYCEVFLQFTADAVWLSHLTFQTHTAKTQYRKFEKKYGIAHCAVGGFNVSNLMGIIWRKIDIGKKITFYFLQNVWICTVFFAFAFKLCKKCYCDPTFFFLKISLWVSKKRRILCWFQIRWCRLKKMPLKKARAKKQCEFWVFSFLCIFSWFFAFNFC